MPPPHITEKKTGDTLVFSHLRQTPYEKNYTFAVITNNTTT